MTDSQKGRKRGEGHTLIEVLISVALLAVVALLVAPLLHMSQVTLTLNDARSLMKKQAEHVSFRIASNLKDTKRIFTQEAISFNPVKTIDNFSDAIDMTDSPPRMNGTILFPPLTYAEGNSLFVARQCPPLDVEAGGRTIRIDIYQFLYYYIALDPAVSPIANQPARELYEWKSVRYADIGQLEQIDLLARDTAVQELRAKKIFWAYNIYLQDVKSAFSQLRADGTIEKLSKHFIQRSALAKLTQSSGGRVFSNFRLGICPNTTNLGFATDIKVPEYIPWGFTWVDPSPSGFAVWVKNSSQRGNTLVTVRIVLAVSGPIERPILQHESEFSVNVRDVW